MMRAPDCAALAHNLGVARVDRQRNTGAPRQTLDDGQHAPAFVLDTERLGPGTGRLPADVQDVRTLRLELEAVRDGGIGCEIAAAVGEAVRRDVDDAHEARPVERETSNVGTRAAAGDAGAALHARASSPSSSLAATTRRSAIPSTRSINSAAANRRSVRPATIERRRLRGRRRRWSQASDRANVKACRHSVLVLPFTLPTDQGCAVPIPAGPPLVLMVPTFCNDRPVRPE